MGGRYGFAAKVNAVPQMHQTHAKTAQDKTGPSLCAKKDGFRIPDSLGKIFGIFFSDMFDQKMVLLEYLFKHILKGELFILDAVFRCRIVFQNNLFNLDGRYGTFVK